MTKRVAVLVDGENISAVHCDDILKTGRQNGRVDIARVYMNAQQNSLWHDASSFHLIHSGTGKNATDLMLAIDAIELALRQNIDTLIIASSDGDFVHLHRRLREYGGTTIGVGEAKTPANVRCSCSQFFELSSSTKSKPETNESVKTTEMDQQIQKIIAANSKNGAGMRLTILGAKMHRQHGVKISEQKDKTWRHYLQSKPELYDLDKAGQDAHVRFKPDGFARNLQPK
ncbi:NYN domain-containing protein [Ruegeria arenilitoris]|uniref:NYN domain-containing protein n=1 Tax=Ruegeria arenilitoris TaxID=1173585 RepID=UPI00147A4D60|nr:NYN domain-containing protein [Ruegeria arenilitoris]